MKLNVYTIFDTASGLYLRPLFAQADGEALRSFHDAVTSDTEFGKHPEDYSIHRVGIYDDATGTLTDEINTCLSTGLECVARARTIKPSSLKDELPDNYDEPEYQESLRKLSPGGTA